ncbi:MAG: TrbI/VirB10 family protein [Hyphomicrobiaceae bacterium]
MTGTPTPEPPKAAAKETPEAFELKARPQPVTKINRTILIGGATIGLSAIAGLVLIALRPPSSQSPETPEQYTVDRKPVSDGLASLPSSYDGVRVASPSVNTTVRERPLAPGVAKLEAPTTDAVVEAEQIEKARLSRMAGQAREAPVFFRLQLKPAPNGNQAQAIQTEPAARTQIAAGSIGSAAGTAPPSTTPGRPAETGIGDLPVGISSDQTRKLAFLKSGPEKEVYNPHTLQAPVSPYQLTAGTIIAASLLTGLNSDLPGFVIAQVTETVFDSASGRYVLIPQGSRLIGKYDNVVAFGQERALVIWQRIIRPDGSSILIDNLPATDSGGYAGLTDEVNLHTWKLLKGVALATLLGVGSSLAFGPGNGDSDLIRALKDSTGQTANRAGQRLVERELTVQPTLTVRPGWPVRVIVHKDIVLTPYHAPGSNG